MALGRLIQNPRRPAYANGEGSFVLLLLAAIYRLDDNDERLGWLVARCAHSSRRPVLAIGRLFSGGQCQASPFARRHSHEQTSAAKEECFISPLLRVSPLSLAPARLAFDLRAISSGARRNAGRASSRCRERFVSPGTSPQFCFFPWRVRSVRPATADKKTLQNIAGRVEAPE